MFSLRDFFHLSQLDGWVDQLAGGGSGLTVVAGLDAQPGKRSLSNSFMATGWLPSGRSAILSILIDQVLTKQPGIDCLVVAQDEHAIRISKQFRRRMRLLKAEPPFSYAGRVDTAIAGRTGLLVLDRLDQETTQLALTAAQAGLFVIAPLDTVFTGSEVARQLLYLGSSAELLPALRWVISVQRLGRLCQKCKQPVQLDEDQSYRLHEKWLLSADQADMQDDLSALSNLGDLKLFQSSGCSACRHTGRQGEVAVFDVFHNPDQAGRAAEMLNWRSVLPMEVYVGWLVQQGYLSPDDFLDFHAEQFRRIGYSLLEREAQLAETSAEHERKLAELEAANRVLQQRTRTLISLQEMGQALISSADLHDLANRVCRFAQTLCGVDRIILYYLLSDLEAERLAESGWGEERVPRWSDPSAVLADEKVIGLGDSSEPASYNRWPPGIPARHPDVEGAELRAGVYVPMVVQGKRVGFILAHTTRKAAFSPKDISLLTTLAQQAALGIQRDRLVEDLRNKIIQLEAAQEGLAKKERLERELELARQVQQSMLPRDFPEIPGFRFSARNIPARQVGGDFYDVIPLDQDRFGLAIADVSDKGLPAALYMALTRSLLRAEARRQSSPRAVLSNVNQLLLELGDETTFVTLFYGVVERKSGRMRYCRAGHDRPILLRTGSGRILGGDGTPVGILDSDFRLTEEGIQLKSGDRLVLYTDGLTDVAAPDGTLFSHERLVFLLEKLAAYPFDQMDQMLFAQLLEFQGESEQYDDMSLLTMEVV